jgi:hypothetical protein
LRGAATPEIVIEARGRSQNLAKAKRQHAQKHNGNCDMTAGRAWYATHRGLPFTPSVAHRTHEIVRSCANLATVAPWTQCKLTKGDPACRAYRLHHW